MEIKALDDCLKQAFEVFLQLRRTHRRGSVAKLVVLYSAVLVHAIDTVTVQGLHSSFVVSLIKNFLLFRNFSNFSI